MSVSSLHDAPHSLGETCPWCEQPVSHAKFEEIHKQIQANERAQTRAIERRLNEEHERKVAEAKAFADADIAKAKHDAEAAIALAAKRNQAVVEAARQAATVKATEENAAKIKAAEDAKALADRLLADERTASADTLSKQREALEDHSTKLLAAEKARAFEEQQKLERKIDDLKRQVQKKTAGELGEGAELDLYEELRREFPTDDIKRVKKGLPGADIVHRIIENGVVAGCLVYDSKNRSAWRNDYVTKLRSDQLAAKADHAILATRVFPSGTAQLATQDGVIIANPARVIALAGLIRGHLTHLATLRLSESDRAEKMAAVYDFVTSERCNQLFAQMDTLSADLLTLDTKEKKSHDDVWKRRGELVRTLQKTQGTLTSEIDLIVTAPGAPASSAT